jgi:hypothetical protein
VTFRDFEEFFASLNGQRARYLIVGGYAVGFHARPRATKDIDVLVDRTPANARRVVAAIQGFLGAAPSNMTEQKLMNPRTLVVLGVAPIRIDILTSVEGVPSFAGARLGGPRISSTPRSSSGHPGVASKERARGGAPPKATASSTWRVAAVAIENVSARERVQRGLAFGTIRLRPAPEKCVAAVLTGSNRRQAGLGWLRRGRRGCTSARLRNPDPPSRSRSGWWHTRLCCRYH